MSVIKGVTVTVIVAVIVVEDAVLVVSFAVACMQHRMGRKRRSWFWGFRFRW